MVRTNNPGPLVTIAIPTYNRADSYLREALVSATKQTYGNLEILVADNCSSDNTPGVVRGFTDPRIQYFRHSTNIGANYNLNWCVNHAKGAFVLMLHDDDLIDEDCIDSCMKAADFSTDVGIIRTGSRVIDSFGRILIEKENVAAGLSNDQFIMAFLERKLHMFLCGSLFNTKRLREIGGIRSPHNCWCDVHAEFQLAARFGRIDVRAIKGSFRKHSSENTYKVDIREWIQDSLFLLDALCDLCPEKNTQIRKQGMWYFANQCYNIASTRRRGVDRLQAYWSVYKEFRVVKNTVPSMYRILPRTPLYYPLRALKRTVNRAFGGS